VGDATKNALGHIGFGLLLVLPAAIVAYAFTHSLTTAAWIGWAVQSAYWLGRERRDHEIKAGLNPVTQWYQGWNPFAWSADGQRDLFWPVAVNALLPALVTLICL
jgi:hypothetical protein